MPAPLNQENGTEIPKTQQYATRGMFIIVLYIPYNGIPLKLLDGANVLYYACVHPGTGSLETSTHSFLWDVICHRTFVYTNY